MLEILLVAWLWRYGYLWHPLHGLCMAEALTNRYRWDHHHWFLFSFTRPIFPPLSLSSCWFLSDIHFFYTLLRIKPFRFLSAQNESIKRPKREAKDVTVCPLLRARACLSSFFVFFLPSYHMLFSLFEERLIISTLRNAYNCFFGLPCYMHAYQILWIITFTWTH